MLVTPKADGGCPVTVFYISWQGDSLPEIYISILMIYGRFARERITSTGFKIRSRSRIFLLFLFGSECDWKRSILCDIYICERLFIHPLLFYYYIWGIIIFSRNKFSSFTRYIILMCHIILNKIGICKVVTRFKANYVESITQCHIRLDCLPQSQQSDVYFIVNVLSNIPSSTFANTLHTNSSPSRCLRIQKANGRDLRPILFQFRWSRFSHSLLIQ